MEMSEMYMEMKARELCADAGELLWRHGLSQGALSGCDQNQVADLARDLVDSWSASREVADKAWFVIDHRGMIDTDWLAHASAFRVGALYDSCVRYIEDEKARAANLRVSVSAFIGRVTVELLNAGERVHAVNLRGVKGALVVQQLRAPEFDSYTVTCIGKGSVSVEVL